MIVVMKPGATQEQVNRVCQRIEELGLKATGFWGRTNGGRSRRHREKPRFGSITARADRRSGAGGADRCSLQGCQSRAPDNTTVVRAGSLEIGGKRIGVIAGPCSVESEEQIIASAQLVKLAGATGLRGGAFKPRTSPYSFQGLKEEGLKLLALAREKTGLAVVTEVMAPHAVGLVSEYADVLQIGARNMQNFDLLAEVGMQPKPVLIKRGASATVEEFLLAAEYILDRGNKQVMLCERGIRTFETHVRFTLPLAIVPYLKERTHLPIVIDPSHGTGMASLVPAMAKAAIAAGADGLIVEVHPHPEKAWSDGAQTLAPGPFMTMMNECRRVAEAVDRSL